MSSTDPGPIDQESPVSAMGTASVICNHIQPESEGFYGESSAAAFFSQVQESLHKSTGKIHVQFYAAVPTSNLSASDAFLSGPSPLHSLDDYSLPPRSFLRAYKRLWSATGETGETEQLHDSVGLGASDCPPSSFYSALNIMFALGLQFSNEPFENREAMSKVFFCRSWRLSQINLLDHGSLGQVQALLIMAQYLQSTNLPNRCWNIVGLACRVAQGLGLHLQDWHGSRSQLAVEMRRRAWHGCVLLDTVLSMTLGRPPTTSYKSAIPLPSAIDDEYLIPGESNCKQPENVFSRTTFFVQTIKLNRILSEVLSEVYDPWNNMTDESGGEEGLKNQLMTIVAGLDTKLEHFEKDLPSAFRWSGVNVNELRPEKLIELQRNVLSERSTAREILRFLQKMRSVIQSNGDVTPAVPDPHYHRQGNQMDSQGSEHAHVEAVPDLSDLDFTVDSSLEHMDVSGFINFLWKDSWTFTSGDPANWGISHIEDNNSGAQSREHEQFILRRHGTLNLDPVPSASPDDPLNWPTWKKNIQIFMVVCHAAMSTFCSAGCIPAFPTFAEKYGISVDEAAYLTSVQIAFLGVFPFFWNPIASRFGRHPVFLFSTFGSCICNIGGFFCKTYGAQMTTRVFFAILCCPPLGIGSAVVTELFFSHERAQKMGWWTVMITLGIPLGPVIFGTVVYHIGVDWIFGISAIINMCQFLAYLVFGQETLYNRSLNSNTPEGNEKRAKRRWLSFHRLDRTPFSIRDFFGPLALCRFPEIILPAIAHALAFTYGNTAITVELPSQFAELFHFNAQQIGLQYISVVIGAVLGEHPAHRLWIGYIGFVTTVVGIIVWGAELQKVADSHDSWNVKPLVGAAIANFGSQVVTTTLITFAIDTHEGRSAGVGVFVTLVRQIYAFVSLLIIYSPEST
ncbi:predicted protein [Paecilomyces variotii No. 5]|uniref:Xylanolytic transcriptional activator regulatory domain-containing protein n=1 Tax=Byssochlamys spectabilis (strain No. 5 / NBRC 109023) TaxID=1356009 RepID=V5G752_BYSSN|nr:predicted protein [Paecilomyces variotii No. 5]